MECTTTEGELTVSLKFVPLYSPPVLDTVQVEAFDASRLAPDLYVPSMTEV